VSLHHFHAVDPRAVGQEALDGKLRVFRFQDKVVVRLGLLRDIKERMVLS